MKIRVIGGGWYGSSIALSLIEDGHDVELWEIADDLFAGASGGNPARCHLGFHYPRSRLTRVMCQEHSSEFMQRYGHLTSSVPVNIYAIADSDSLVDFGTYCQVLRGEVEFVTIHDPSEFGLQNVEGAVLTGERHIVIRKAREYFRKELDGFVKYNKAPTGDYDDFDLVIDCTFCAMDAANIDRYEPCITGILKGPTDMAVTIMDGPFPSIYPWDEESGLLSITSASLTPLNKTCKTYGDAKEALNRYPKLAAWNRVQDMIEQIANYWPDARQKYSPVDYKKSIRAMPKSAADARLVDVVRVAPNHIRIRAGKIDAILAAERAVKDIVREMC